MSATFAKNARAAHGSFRHLPLFRKLFFFGIILLSIRPAMAQTDDNTGLYTAIDDHADKLKARVIEWRRDIHAHPELSNRETRTAKLVAGHLTGLGLEVRTEVAHTGVVALLRGGKPGPVVALRADMDALPVTEETGLPFASKVRTQYMGQEVGVMHACGHDAHTAILMGAAEILSSLKEQLPGTIKFIFQPAEEGAPDGEDGGAGMMIQEGALENPAPGAIFGLHTNAFLHTGTLGYHSGGTMASTDGLSIIVRGKQSHGAAPWKGVDPIVVSAQIILGLQTIVSRQIELTKAPAVVTIGKIEGGVRSNIIPDEVRMIGTIRNLDPEIREEIRARVKRTAGNIAESAGAEAIVEVSRGLPVTYNDPELTKRMLPALERIAGRENVIDENPHTGAEDFSLFAEKIPGFYFFIGITPHDRDLKEAASLHSPKMYLDEEALTLGVRAITNAAVDYLLQNR